MKHCNEEKRVQQPNKEALQKRLKRVGGQVQGIARMIEEDRYCVDVLVQVSAVRAALDKVALQLIENHTKGCVRRAIRDGDGNSEAVIEELMDVLGRFTR